MEVLHCQENAAVDARHLKGAVVIAHQALIVVVELQGEALKLLLEAAADHQSQEDEQRLYSSAVDVAAVTQGTGSDASMAVAAVVVVVVGEAEVLHQ